MSLSPFRHFPTCARQVCAALQTALTHWQAVDTVFIPMQAQHKMIRLPVKSV